MVTRRWTTTWRRAAPCAVALAAMATGASPARAGDVEESAADLLRQRLERLDTPLPCPVSDVEVEGSFHGPTVTVVLAERGCSAGAVRDAEGDAPADTAAYRAILGETIAVLEELGLGTGRRLKVVYAVQGWLGSVDLGAYARATGGDEMRLKQATTWYPKAPSGTGDDDGGAVAEGSGAGEDVDPATLVARLGHDALTMEAVTDALRAMRPLYAACRAEQQRRDGREVVGQVVLRVMVRTTGQVTRVRAVRSTVGSIPLENCLVRTTGDLVFPPSETGEQFQVDWPVDFE